MTEVIVKVRGDNLPKQQTSGSAGFDLRTNIPHPMVLGAGERMTIPTGLFMEIPEGFVGLVAPRSGTASRYGITVLNAPGIIDSDFRGEVKVILLNTGDDDLGVFPGERIAQLLITPAPSVTIQHVGDDELSETARGDRGFGSTGMK